MTRPALRGNAVLPACAASLLVLASVGRADAADCALEPQGEGRVAAVVDSRSLRLEDGREIRLAGIERAGTDRASGRAALVRHRRRPRGDAAWRRRHAGSLWPPGRLCVRDRLGTLGAKRAAAPRRGAGFGRYIRKKLRCSPRRRRGRGTGCQIGHLGRSHGHKKRGKSGRYSVRDWAFFGSRGQSSVRSAGRGNHLPEFRAELDTGLCCDYFKAHHTGVRERQPWT